MKTTKTTPVELSSNLEHEGLLFTVDEMFVSLWAAPLIADFRRDGTAAIKV